MLPASLLRHWPVAALLASAAMLATAHGFQFAGYQPCALCLRQREVYWVAMAVAAAAFLAPRLIKAPILPTLGNIALALVFLWSLGVATYHAGAEWKFWPGPTTCAAAGSGSFDAKSVLEALDKPMHPPSCEDAAWRLFGISMAGYNALISAALAGASLLAALHVRPKAAS
jgi:disulfide bond formation protein DsbB